MKPSRLTQPGPTRQNRIASQMLCSVLIAVMVFVCASSASSGDHLLYVRGSYYYPEFDSLLLSEGYVIEYSEVIPDAATLSTYDAVLVTSYPACNSVTADYLREYLIAGGGVVLISGTPWALSGGTNLSPILDWFGATTYVNSGGLALYADQPAPFDAGLSDGDLLLDVTGSHSNAAITGVLDVTHIVGTWQDGSTFSFWNYYGDGRMFYNAEMLSGRNDDNNGSLWAAGIQWAAGEDSGGSDPSDRCDQIVFLPETGHWYERVVMPPNTTWETCRDSARALGGYLATAHSFEENGFIADLSAPFPTFIGGFEPTEGTWEWVTGEPWTFEAWRPGEPNEAFEGEDFVSIWYQDSLWNDSRNWFIPAGAFVAEYDSNPCESATTVSLDIKPGSCPNPLNVKGGGRGMLAKVTGDTGDSSFGNLDDWLSGDRGAVLPAAILGTERLDVSEIDVATITLAGVPILRSAYEDVATPMPDGADDCECHGLRDDGYLDLTLKFDRQAIIDALGDVVDGEVVPMTITGQMFDGTEFEGNDCMWIRGKRELPAGDDLSGKVESHLPEEFTLGQNYPNPFNPITEINFELPVGCQARLEVYNMLGQKVALLVNAPLPAGSHSYIWDGTDMSSGVYFYRLEAGDFTETRKMVLMK